MIDPITGAALVQIGSGAYRMIKAQRGIDELERQKRRTYTEAAQGLRESKQIAETRRRMGLSPQARTLAQNEIMRNQRNLLRTPASGQLRDQLGRTAAATQASGALGLAAMDEKIRQGAEKDLMQINRELTNAAYRDVAQENKEYLMEASAYGKAKQEGRRSIMGAIGGVAQASMYGYGPLANVGGSTPKMPQAPTTQASTTQQQPESVGLVQQPGSFPLTRKYGPAMRVPNTMAESTPVTPPNLTGGMTPLYYENASQQPSAGLTPSLTGSMTPIKFPTREFGARYVEPLEMFPTASPIDASPFNNTPGFSPMMFDPRVRMNPNGSLSGFSSGYEQPYGQVTPSLTRNMTPLDYFN